MGDDMTPPIPVDQLQYVANQIERLTVKVERVDVDLREIREIQRGGDKSKWERVWAFTTQMALPVGIISVGFAWNLHDRVAHIEHTRFTNLDFQKAIGQLTLQMAGGPDWLRDSLSKLTASIDLTRDDVGSLKERLIRLETKMDSK